MLFFRNVDILGNMGKTHYFQRDLKITKIIFWSHGHRCDLRLLHHNRLRDHKTNVILVEMLILTALWGKSDFYHGIHKKHHYLLNVDTKRVMAEKRFFYVITKNRPFSSKKRFSTTDDNIFSS